MLTISREEAVTVIRRKLLEMVDEDHSMCQVAAEKGILCRGFRQYSDDQLRERYHWIVKRHPEMSREELEDRANRWQLARQIVQDVPISCDAQAREHDTCHGWDMFDDAALARFYRDLAGEDVTVEG